MHQGAVETFRALPWYTRSLVSMYKCIKDPILANKIQLKCFNVPFF